MSGGGVEEYKGGLDGEAFIPQYGKLMFIASLPPSVRSVIASVLDLAGQTRPAAILRATKAKTEYEHNQYVVRKNAYCAKFTAAMVEAGTFSCRPSCFAALAYPTLLRFFLVFFLRLFLCDFYYYFV